MYFRLWWSLKTKERKVYNYSYLWKFQKLCLQYQICYLSCLADLLASIKYYILTLPSLFHCIMASKVFFYRSFMGEVGVDRVSLFFHGLGSKAPSALFTAQKMKFSIKDFFSKCHQIRRKLSVLKKRLMENFIFFV